jgi:hypothetical protein
LITIALGLGDDYRLGLGDDDLLVVDDGDDGTATASLTALVLIIVSNP